MREIQASKAKTHLRRLLADVERGETLIITRHGRPIARLVPEGDVRQAERDAAITRMQERRGRAAPITAAELLSAREEGRR